MYLHIGSDCIVRKEDVVAICDLDNTTGSRITRDYLAQAQKSGLVINAAEDIPRSFIVCRDGRVYLSQLTPSTLNKRTSEII